MRDLIKHKRYVKVTSCLNDKKIS